MGDDDWDASSTGTTAAPARNDENNNEDKPKRSFGFGSRDNNNNDSGTSLFKRDDRREGSFGGNRGGFSGGGRRDDNNREGGFNRPRDGSNGGGGFRRDGDNNSRGGGFNRGAGFGNRRNDENGDNNNRSGGFSNKFTPRQQDGDNDAPRRSYGDRNNDNGGGRGGFSRGGFGDRRGGDDNYNRDGSTGGRSFGQRRDNGEDNGSEKRNFGGFNRNNDNGGDGEKKSFGSFRKDGENGGFRSNRDGNGESKPRFGGNRDDNGESKPRFGGNRDENGENRPRFGGNRDNNGDSKPRFNRDRDDNGEGKPRFGGNRDGGERGERGEGGEGDEKKERYIPEELDESEEAIFATIATGVNFQKQAEIKVTVSGDNNDTQPLERFSEAGLSDILYENIKKSKYEIPTPVQRYAIPIMLKKRDLMACAQTGSGKTAAYLIPIMTNILHDGIASGEFSTVQEPQALILAPTRELARQIWHECRKFGHGSIIKSQVLYGGTVTGYQINEISKGCNILVATPGRLLDVLNKGKITFDKLKYIVLDEADRMLDYGFEGNVREILGKCTLDKSERCTFMFSATFPDAIQKLAQDFLQNYLFISVGVIGGANADVKQELVKATRFEKNDKLMGMLNEIGNERTMIFVEHKKQADILGFLLIQKNYPTTTMHGDRLQSQREAALKDFRNGVTKIIVCTSVAARGLDISDVTHVINYDLPQTIDEYVHRIGRTGRCGNIGKAISFFDTTSENDTKLARSLVRILIDANQEVPDWLSSAAEDTVGSSYGHGKQTDDLRGKFQSLAMNESKPLATAAPAENDDDWG